MTHGYIKESGLFGSGLMASRNIKDSGRFADVLKKYKVDLGLCGHTHLSHSFNNSVKFAEELNNRCFINVSAIRGSRFTTVESYLLYFKNNSDELIARSRDHEEKKFNMKDVNIKLSYKFRWDGSPPVIQKMDQDKSVAARSSR
jgi:hypothetical protein